jgi:aspartyl/glutamyl-tRNA(Asn/Gln) amidotransferase C subunit
VGVTRAEIRRIAELAELAVDEEAAAELEAQLSRILDYVAQLSELPAGGAELEDERAAGLRRDVPDADPLAVPPSAWAAGMRSGLSLVPRLGELDRGSDAP